MRETLTAEKLKAMKKMGLGVCYVQIIFFIIFVVAMDREVQFILSMLMITVALVVIGTIFKSLNYIIEAVLYPILVYIYFTSLIPFSYIDALKSSNLIIVNLIIIISLLFIGLGLHYVRMEIANKKIKKTDIYIYIYSLLNIIPIFFLIVNPLRKKSSYLKLLPLVFYFLNIIYFYWRKKEKAIKIIVVPTLVLSLCFFPLIQIIYGVG